MPDSELRVLINGLRSIIEVNDGKPVAPASGNLPVATVKVAKRLGAASCIQKTLSAKSLVNTLRFIATGGKVLPVAMNRTQAALVAQNARVVTASGEMVP